MIEEMKRFGLIAILATLLILVGRVFLFSRGNKPPTVQPLTNYEYYWGNGCPHCEVVDEFFKSWEGKDKVAIEKREVWYNKANAQIMAARGEACGIAKSDLAVPFLVTPEGKCLLGDEPIINLFKELKF